MVDEVRKAVEMCYILVNVFEFWVYKVACFEFGTNSGDLFCRVCKYVAHPDLNLLVNNFIFCLHVK